jgi:frataxin
MALDDSSFARLADGAMDRLMDRIEGGCPDADAELEGGILTVELADGGKYVLNKHGPLKQLWLSSPKSGAWHFAYDEAKREWRSTRGPETLPQVLARELGEATGAALAFD